MQRWARKLESYLKKLSFIWFKINGRKKTEAINVVDILMNNRMPIEEVPLWEEMARVLKDAIVVNALNIIALGVLLEITEVNFSNSVNLLKK